MISKVLFQWDALRLHFELARTQDRCFTADLLWRMFSDPVNKVYLTFLCNELQAICRVNKAFQAENADITKLHGDLNDYFISLIQKIVPPSNLKNVSLKNLSDFDFTTSLMPPSAIHLGHSVHLLMDSFKMSPDTIEAIKSVCFKFLVELATQIKNRLPDNFSVLRDLDLLSPRNATSQMKSSIIPLASKVPTIAKDLDVLEREWKLLPTKSWCETSNLIQFWAEVFSSRNSTGERSFGNIGRFALSLLSLPFSNAPVERIFSQMNATKTKQRNRMAVKTSNAILQVEI